MLPGGRCPGIAPLACNVLDSGLPLGFSGVGAGNRRQILISSYLEGNASAPVAIQNERACSRLIVLAQTYWPPACLLTPNVLAQACVLARRSRR